MTRKELKKVFFFKIIFLVTRSWIEHLPSTGRAPNQDFIKINRKIIKNKVLAAVLLLLLYQRI